MARLSVVAFLRQFIEEEEVAVFDGATIVMPETTGEGGQIFFTVELTLGGSPIGSYAFVPVYVMVNDQAFTESLQNSSSENTACLIDGGSLMPLSFVHYDPALAPHNLQINAEGAPGSYRVVVALPNGGIVIGSEFVIEEPPPP